MGPHHIGVGAIDVGVVGVVHILANFNGAEIALKHLFDRVHDETHLHFDHENQTATVARLQVGAVETEKIREVRHRGTEVGFGVVISPGLTQTAAATDAEQFFRLDVVFGLTPRRSCRDDRALFIVGEAFNERGEFALAVDHGRDEHSLVTYTKDDAIAVDQEFSDNAVVELGDSATGAREALKLAGRKSRGQSY